MPSRTAPAVAPPPLSSSTASSPRRSDSRALPALKPSTHYYNNELPDAQGLGVDGRNTRVGEPGWAIPATPMSPIASLHPALTRYNSSDQLENSSHQPSQDNNQPDSHDAIPSSWAFINGNLNSFTSKPSKSRRLKSLLGFQDDADVLSLMDVSLDEIVRGKTCKPLSLNDLRTYLRDQRLSTLNSSFSAGGAAELDFSLLGGASKQSKNGIAPPPSASLCSNLTVSMSMNDPHPEMCERYHLNHVDQETTLVPISETTNQTSNETPPNGDELDALQFLASYERYRRRFASLSRSEKNRCPRIQSNGEVGLRTMHSRADSSGALSNLTGDSTLPLRKDLDRICETHLSPSRSGKGGDGKARPKRRLQWMVDLGLLSEELISTVLNLGEQTTHPSLLEPIYDIIYSHLAIHVLPNFLLNSTRNLSKTTRKGRLAIGIVSIILSVLFTVLLLLRPSPLSSDDTNVTRWFRLLTFPLWTAGFGYVLAARTGVCVWLTLRGNREPEDDGIRWENHSVDGDRETVRGDRKMESCKPCQGDRCWENEEEKEEMEGEIKTSGSSNSSPASKQSREKADGSDREENEDQEVVREKGSAWLAPELLDLLAKFRMAPKFLYGSNPNQCGINGSCNLPTSTSSNHQIQTTSTSNPDSSWSQFSRKSNSISIITPLPLAYSSDSSPTSKSNQRGSLREESMESLREPKGSPSVFGGGNLPRLEEKMDDYSKNHVSDNSDVSISIILPEKASNVQTQPQSQASDPKSSNSSQHPQLTVKNLQSSSTSSIRRRREDGIFRRSWTGVKRWTGFAVRTEKVNESKVRQIQQRIALKALISCFVYSILVVIIITAVP